MPRALLNGATFTVSESDLDVTGPVDPDVTYELRPVTVDTARGMIRRHTRRRRRGEEQTDDKAVHAEMLDFAIVSWDGVVDGGTPADCTLENKLKLPGSIQAALLERAQMGGDPAEEAASFRES